LGDIKQPFIECKQGSIDFKDPSSGIKETLIESRGALAG